MERVPDQVSTRKPGVRTSQAERKDRRSAVCKSPRGNDGYRRAGQACQRPVVWATRSRRLRSWPKKQEECCDAILKKLDKLDEILAALKHLKDENARLRSDVDTLKQAQTGIEKEVAQVSEDASGIRGTDRPDSPKKPRRRRSDRALTSSRCLASMLERTTRATSLSPVRVDFSHPSGSTLRSKSEAEYMGWRQRKEGQFDFGMVGRFGAFQAGLFSSFKHVNLSEFERGGTVGQASLTGDYIFGRGRVGIFGSKGFMDSANIGEQFVGPNTFQRTYLAVVDQLGLSGTVGLLGRTFAEGNLGWLKGRDIRQQGRGHLALRSTV